VDADSYLLELVKYIHRNPLRAGIVKSMDKYPWSSHKGYFSRSKQWNWMYKDIILSMLTKDKSKWRKAYLDLINQGESQEIEDFFNKKNLPAILGTKEFIDRMKKKFYKKKYDRNIPESRILAPTVKEIKHIVVREYNISPDALVLSRRGSYNEPRNVAIYLARKYTQETLLCIGCEFNMGQYSSVSSVIKNMKMHLLRNKKLRKRVESLEKRLKIAQR